eukprot:Clim_evm56s146 gene=Clim_evmTU56s146
MSSNDTELWVRGGSPRLGASQFTPSWPAGRNPGPRQTAPGSKRSASPVVAFNVSDMGEPQKKQKTEVQNNYNSNRSESTGGEPIPWITWWLQLRYNSYLCRVCESYIRDPFNLQGLNRVVKDYNAALEWLLAVGDVEFYQRNVSSEVNKSAEILYGLVHARFLITGPGLERMAEKFERKDFGVCPRVYCEDQAVLPIGESDTTGVSAVRLYCPRCRDIFVPRSKRKGYIDGAFFGTSYPHLLFEQFPELAPLQAKRDYVPRVFGFKIHPSAPSYPKQLPPVTTATSSTAKTEQGNRTGTLVNGGRTAGAGARKGEENRKLEKE